MSIRKKTLVVIIITSVILFFCLMIVSFNLLLKGFNTIEDKNAEENSSRAVDTLKAKIDEIATKLYDWSQWDDSYAFMKNHNKSFIASNLTDETFTALKINMVIFIDQSGKIIFSKYYNFKSAQIEPLPPELLPYLQKDSILLKHPDPNSVVKGMINLPGEDLLIASRPIVTSKGAGPILGTAIFARYFDDELKRNISDVTHLSLSFLDLDNPDLSSKEKNIQTVLIHQNAYVTPVNNDIIESFSLFRDINRNPLFLIKITLERDIHQQGLQSIYSFFVIYSILAIAFAILILILLEKIVLSKIDTLSSVVQKIRSDKQATLRVNLSGNDELSQLAKEINGMLDSLQEFTSEIQKDEKKIEQEKIRDETMLESIGEGLLVTDKNGVTLLANSSAQKMLCYHANDLVGKRLDEVLTMTDEVGETIAPNQSIIETVLKSGEKISKTYYFIRKDGRKFPSIITTTAIVLDGKIIGAISVLRDITKEKDVDRMKTEFISLASHQLRSPLTAIKWFTESLLSGKDKLDKDQKEYITSIDEANERMIDLVTSLLNISRIESGRIIIEPKLTDISDLLKMVEKEQSAKLKEKNLSLKITIDPNVPKVMLDPKLIQNVYSNLLSNSIKYSHEKSEITIHISKKDDAVISEITDHGYGIPLDQQPKLFKKFFRAENVSKKVTDGTGLGLYLVKLILDISEGKIWLKSAEDQGSTFWFSLPINGIPPKKGEVSLN